MRLTLTPRPLGGASVLCVDEVIIVSLCKVKSEDLVKFVNLSNVDQNKSGE